MRSTAEPLITIAREEVTGLPPADWDQTIIATGPLTAPGLAEAISAETGQDALAFFDAIAPIIHTDSIDMSVCWFQSRYDKVGPGGTGKDYINCPMDKDQYDAFIDALIAGDTRFKEWEGTPYFDGCLPIEIMAERGRETLRHGPMKPMGLTNAHNPDIKAYAVVQLRQDNALGTLYNMVGFQTKLKYGAQADIFRMIPGLENAEFARLGGLHRNTYLNSPLLLDAACSSRAARACALPVRSPAARAMSKARPWAARRPLRRSRAHWRRTGSVPPATTAFGALLNHITGGHLLSADEPGKRSFQPMNVNFGLFPATRARRHCPPRRRGPFSRQGQGKGEKAGAGSPRSGGFCSMAGSARPSRRR
jgi:methylenetetrahydrofolate--tRNA-(uracil-5-)-methyltransferase